MEITMRGTSAGRFGPPFGDVAEIAHADANPYGTWPITRVCVASYGSQRHSGATFEPSGGGILGTHPLALEFLHAGVALCVGRQGLGAAD
jgi:hypothetical protein